MHENLDGLSEKIKRVVKLAHRDLIADITGNLSEYAPKDTGDLQVSFHMEQTGELEARAVSDVNYAIPVSEGTDPHEIWPDEQKALAFEWPTGPTELLEKFEDKTKGDDVVILGKVEHPGIEGTGYIDDAISDATDRIDWFVERALREVDL